jgi:peroxiredoxin
MRFRSVSLATMAVFLMHAVAAADDATPSSAEGREASATDRKPITDPVILLIRDDTVRAELKLSNEQRRAIDDLLMTHNRLLLAIRDVSPSGADETARPALTELHEQFARILSDEQRTRLTNLILQAQGYDAILRGDVATKLGLTEKQQRDLAAISDRFRAAAQEVGASTAGKTPEQVQQNLAKLQKNRQKKVLAVLNESQTAQYAAMLGEPFDFSKVKGSPADAPEFEGIDAWMNSEPITMESLRGKVVVVHFFAFGCINCIHNYPWYKDWHERLAGNGVTIIGIHTPETASEADNELLQASLEEQGLEFPVAQDKQRKMWQAWYNGIWPSVYIIDKRGRLRYWWYGELDWQGAGNQKVAERQIAQLLNEE